VWLDPEAAHGLAGGCRSAADAAEQTRGDVLAAMTLSELTDVATPGVLAELADELTTLARLLDLRADLMEYADIPSSEGWVRALYDQAAAAEAELLAALDDEDGANRMDAAPFTLAGSVVPGDPSAWIHAVAPPGCEWFTPDRGYWGGGFVVGPDGRRYPIVIPHLEVDGHVYTGGAGSGIAGWIDDGSACIPLGSVAELGGADPGWTMVAYRSGVERIVGAPSGSDRFLAAVAGTTGLVHPLPGNELLPGIVMAPERPPAFSADVDALPVVEQPVFDTPLPLVPVTLFVNGRVQQVRADELAFAPRDVRRAAARLGVTPPGGSGTLVAGAVDLAVPVAQGVALAANLDNQHLRAYQVIFEENADGRTRARVETFWLSASDGTMVIHPSHLFVNADGDLAEQPIEYVPEESAATSGDWVVAQGIDLPYDWEVQDAEFPD
jgi:hypothetical protein